VISQLTAVVAAAGDPSLASRACRPRRECEPPAPDRQLATRPAQEGNPHDHDHRQGQHGPTREAQYDAVCTWGIPDHALLQRLSCLQMPVFVANGDSDPMILPHYSYLLAGLIPQAQLKIYPGSAHGFLFQHHAEFAANVRAFLTDSG
jgi:pimeloyl-ACP methyl ester carboxylesterase